MLIVICFMYSIHGGWVNGATRVHSALKRKKKEQADQCALELNRRKVGGGGVGKAKNYWKESGALPGESLRAAASQSSPSRSPSPVVALHACTCHSRCFNCERCNLSVTSLLDNTFAMSCLLANTISFAWDSSEFFSSLWSSSRASEIRSLSLLSTTNIKPWNAKNWHCQKGCCLYCWFWCKSGLYWFWNAARVQ